MKFLFEGLSHFHFPLVEKLVEELLLWKANIKGYMVLLCIDEIYY